MLGPKQSFGEMALLTTAGKRNATITTISETYLVVADKSSYDSIIHIAHKRETQAKLDFVNSLDLFENVSRVRDSRSYAETHRAYFVMLTARVRVAADYRRASCSCVVSSNSE